MFLTDNESVYYNLGPDRVFGVRVDKLLAGMAVAERDGNGGGMGPAGVSPWAADTAVASHDDLVMREDGEPRDLVTFELADRGVLAMIPGRGRTPVAYLRDAISLWADYCDEADALLNRGSTMGEAMAYAGLGMATA